VEDAMTTAAQPEISPEPHPYARALKEKSEYENQSEKQAGKNSRRRQQFGLHFSPVRVKAIIAAIEADANAFVVTT
jgi:hypothetical protein